jgi:acyl-CoA thioesterase-1
MDEKYDLTIYTFGDKTMLRNCDLSAAELLIKNDNNEYPEFKGKDLTKLLSLKINLAKLSTNNATIVELFNQIQLVPDTVENSCAIITIGGMDMVTGLVESKEGKEIEEFKQKLRHFVEILPIRPVLITNVYDPTFGVDAKNFLHVDTQLGRKNHRAINDAIKEVADEFGHYVDIHTHFLTGNENWLEEYYQLAPIGSSEIRRVMLEAFLQIYPVPE